jgi:integral membrane protein
VSTLTPRSLFRSLAVAEAITWALLLFGMFLKYVSDTTELGVRIFGMVHGVVFIAYCLVSVIVAVDQRWSLPRAVLGLAAAVPPFATLPFEVYADRRGLLGTEWLSRPDSPTALQRTVCWLLHRYQLALGLLVVAVGILTAVAPVVGPPRRLTASWVPTGRAARL